LNTNPLFSFLFSVFLVTLPFSKGVAATAYVGLLVLSFVTLFWKKKENTYQSFSQPIDLNKVTTIKKIVVAPTLLLLALLISLLYSQNLSEGLDTLISQSKLIGLPFICYVHLANIQTNYNRYVNLLANAVALAALLTLLCFLLPVPIVQQIAEIITPLKDYVLHEKQHAFGAYSPFLDRLQFSYLIASVFFLELFFLFTFFPEYSKKKVANSTRTFTKSLRFSKRTVRLVILFLTLLILGARGAHLGFILGNSIWLIGIYYYYLHPVLQQKIGAFLSYLLLIGVLLGTTICLPIVAYQKIPAVTMRYDQMMWELGTFQDGTFKNYDYVHFTSIRRLLSWQHSWALVKKQPIFGVGLGDYEVAMIKEYRKDGLGFPVNTQSQFLYYWVSAGLLGIGIFLLVWSYWLLQLMRRQQYWISILIASFFVFYSFIFLLDAPLNFQVGSMTFWLFYTLIAILSFIFEENHRLST